MPKYPIKAKKKFSRVPVQHRKVLQHVVGRDGAIAVARRIQLRNSTLYRILKGAGTGVRPGTLAKVGALVEQERLKGRGGDSASSWAARNNPNSRNIVEPDTNNGDDHVGMRVLQEVVHILRDVPAAARTRLLETLVDIYM